MIPETMFCVDMRSGYDSKDDVMCTQKQGYYSEMIFRVHIKSGYVPRDDVMCTRKIRL